MVVSVNAHGAPLTPPHLRVSYTAVVISEIYTVVVR